MHAAQASDVRLEGITKQFDDVVAVDNISLAIEPGQFFALLGPSGCGKTTTLRMIGGFEEPTSGSIYLGDKDVVGLPPYKRDVNTVFQSYALFPHLSIFENVAFGMRRQGLKGKQLAGRVHAILELVDLARPRDRGSPGSSPAASSSASPSRARWSTSRASCSWTSRSGALDLKLRRQMQLELKTIQHDIGITFIHVTHDQEEAMTMADTIAVMNGGRVEQLGPPTELYERPADRVRRRVPRRLEPPAGNGVRARARSRSKAAPRSRSPREALGSRSGRVAVGIRPEKIRIGAGQVNSLSGTVFESAYVGVSTQYVVDTPAGRLTVYVQNMESGSHRAAPPATRSPSASSPRPPSSSTFQRRRR